MTHAYQPGLALDDLANVPTPALVVDMAAARRNNTRAMRCLGPGQVLRPHFKAHKSLSLVNLQLDGGAKSVCCQTSWEALALARAGVPDIMLTNQVVDATALAELATAAKLSRLSVLVDDVAHVRLLEATAGSGEVKLDVLIEVDLGMKRCGVAVDSDALLALASAIANSTHLTFIGIQAYDGHVASIADPVARKIAAHHSQDLTRQAVSRLNTAGFETPVVAGLSTGHLPFASELDVWTDVQAGSYLLMDGVYADCPDLEFEIALLALATVIHRSAERAVLDVGLKQLAVDRGSPTWIGDPAATLRLSDEHTVIPLTASTDLHVGDRTFVVPRHIDPTVNLHSSLWLYDSELTKEFHVEGRMPSRRVER